MCPFLPLQFRVFSFVSNSLLNQSDYSSLFLCYCIILSIFRHLSEYFTTEILVFQP